MDIVSLFALLMLLADAKQGMLNPRSQASHPDLANLAATAFKTKASQARTDSFSDKTVPTRTRSAAKIPAATRTATPAPLRKDAKVDLGARLGQTVEAIETKINALNDMCDRNKYIQEKQFLVSQLAEFVSLLMGYIQELTGQDQTATDAVNAQKKNPN